MYAFVAARRLQRWFTGEELIKKSTRHKPCEENDVKKGKWMKDPKAIQITVPKGVEHIIRQIEQAGYEAYAVGGCVRDALLG